MESTLRELQLHNEDMTIEVFPHVPRAMGLGGSAALAVAVIRALDTEFELDLSHERVNALAFECEKAAHGTPSGIDNTLATYGDPVLYRNTGTPEFSSIAPGRPLHIAVGLTGKESLTAKTVARVRGAWQRHQTRYDGIFDQIGALTTAAAEAFKSGHLVELGELMNLCQGYLNALQLSTPELEELIHISRDLGCMGAKLTGGGGGGSIIALCESADHTTSVLQGMEAAGYAGFATEVS
jgi:hydroxymethylglutaryl-CoA reductase